MREGPVPTTGDRVRLANDVGKTVGFEAKKEFLRRLWSKKGDFTKAWGQDHGQKELHRGHEEWPIMHFQVGRPLGIA